MIPVDPCLLFQPVLKQTDKELRNYKNYELVPYPLAMFQDGILRKTFNALFSEVPVNLKSLQNVHYFMYGGMLYIVANRN